MILLLGEYSSVHHELANALRQMDENVMLMSDGDAYKKIGNDVQLPALNKFSSSILNKFMNLFRLTGFFGIFNYFVTIKEIEKIENISVAQIINPVAIDSLGAIGNILLIRYLRKRAKILSLCALGDDYHWVSACLKGRFKYSAMDRMPNGWLDRARHYSYSLKYIYSPLYRLLDFYAQKKADVIIPGLEDYRIAYEGHEKLAATIPLPISLKNFTRPQKTKYPIKVFHSWQTGKERKKGNDILDEVIKKYIEKYGTGKVEYEIASNLPYNEYLHKYKNADIFLDQIYSYDRGVSAALGMAAGKVVFSGFEEGDFDIGINATPNMATLYHSFVEVVGNLNILDKIKNNAYEYAMVNYESKNVARKYLTTWHSNSQEYLACAQTH